MVAVGEGVHEASRPGGKGSVLIDDLVVVFGQGDGGRAPHSECDVVKRDGLLAQDILGVTRSEDFAVSILAEFQILELLHLISAISNHDVQVGLLVFT